MANALKTLFSDIAVAIRNKTGKTDEMKPADFPSAIDSIVAGSDGGGTLPSGLYYEPVSGSEPYVYDRIHFTFNDELYMAIMNKSSTSGITWPIYKFADGKYTQLTDVNTGFTGNPYWWKIFSYGGKLHALGNDGKKHYMADGVGTLVLQSVECPVTVWTEYKNSQVCVHNGELYVAGNSEKTIYKWTESGGWELVCSHNLTGYCCLASHKGRLYLWKQGAEIYVVENGTVVLANTASESLSIHSIYYNGYLYTFSTYSFTKYDIDTNAMTTYESKKMCPKHTSRYNYTVHDGKLICDAYDSTRYTGVSYIIHDLTENTGSAPDSSVEGVHFVTFMSEDGQTELFKRPVADGDNCADPVARGLMDAPTKESTNTQHFAFDGWSAEIGGSASDSALSAVTGNRTVYAAFGASTRYYTIRFFDGDTLLHTVLAEYGSTPSYKPEKDGFSFNGWNHAVVAVTENADYYAQWTEAVTFANSSWSDIVRIAESGEAQNYFKLGDIREIDFVFSGTTIKLELQIIGFNHDDLADGTGKANMTIRSRTALNDSTHPSSNTTAYGWGGSQYRTILCNNKIYNALPTELQSAIKPVVKYAKYYNVNNAVFKVGTYNTDKCWSLSLDEVGLGGEVEATEHEFGAEGTAYEFFNIPENRICYNTSGNATLYTTRSIHLDNYKYYFVVKTDGSANKASGNVGYYNLGGTYYNNLSFAFCI